MWPAPPSNNNSDDKGLLEQGADMLSDATGGKVDLTDEAKMADEAIETAVNGGKEAVDGVVEVGTTILEVVGTMFPFPFPGQEIPTLPGQGPTAPAETGPTNGTEGTENEEFDSVFGDVNLNDLNSIEDAIAELQDKIRNGEADGQTFQDLQLLLNAQLQQISLQSNIQKALHDARMAVINNIR